MSRLRQSPLFNRHNALLSVLHCALCSQRPSGGSLQKQKRILLMEILMQITKKTRFLFTQRSVEGYL